MKVNVTQKDIESGVNPIESALSRQFDVKAVVDRKFILFEENRHPFRLPLSAELFNEKWNLGKEVKPFSFDIAG